MQHALRWSLLAAQPLHTLSTLSRPIVWLVGAATNFVVRMLGGDPNVAKEQLSSEELANLVAAHPGLTREQRMIISGALEIHERTLREVLCPTALGGDAASQHARRAGPFPPRRIGASAGTGGELPRFGQRDRCGTPARLVGRRPDGGSGVATVSILSGQRAVTRCASAVPSRAGNRLPSLSTSTAGCRAL